MSTTTGPNVAISYPEHDKLGPLGITTSPILDAAQLRAAIVHAFESAAHGARDAVAAVDKDAPAAVHAARKSLRRARAVLDLVRGALPRGERRALRLALKEARRALSSVRDHAVAPETLSRLTLDDDDRATAKRVLDNAAQAMPATAEVRQLLAESAARAAAQAEALQAALPHEVSWDIVSDGVRTTYGDARRALRAAKRSKAWFHTWRRRSKELVYQLELIAGHAGARAREVEAEIAGATDILGPAVDLIMVRDFVTTYSQGIAPEAIARLRTALGDQLGDLMKDSRKATREIFGAKPRKLEKRLRKAIRRDLAPADEPVEADRKAELPQ